MLEAGDNLNTSLENFENDKDHSLKKYRTKIIVPTVKNETISFENYENYFFIVD